MIEIAQLQRMEEKLDDIRDRMHSIDLSTSMTKLRLDSLEKRHKEAEQEIAALKTAHDKVTGAWKLLTIPGLIAAFATALRYWK